MSPRASASGKSASPTIQINTAAPAAVDQPVQETKVEVERDPGWFWYKIAQIPKDDWGKHYEIWIYRTEPKTRMAVGERGYLAVVVEPISPAWLKANYGGGRFRMCLNKDNRFVTTFEQDIEGMPIYDTKRERPDAVAAAATAAADSTNGLLQQFVGVLRDELARSREGNQGGSGATEEAIKLLSSASDRAMEIVAKQVPQAANPSAQLSEIVTVAKALGLGATAPADGGLGALSQLFLPLLPKLVEKLLTPPDPMAQIGVYLQIFERLEALRGDGGGGGKRDWKAEAINTVKEVAPQVIDMLNQQRQAQAEQQQRVAQQQQRPNRPPPAPQAGPSSVAPPRGGTVATVPPPMPAAQHLRTVPLDQPPLPEPVRQSSVVGLDAYDANNPAYQEFVKRRIVALVQLGQSGESIVDFLDGALPGFSNQLAAFSIPEVNAFLTVDPILSQAVQHPRWNDVLKEAREYILDQEQPEPDAELEKVN